MQRPHGKSRRARTAGALTAAVLLAGCATQAPPPPQMPEVAPVIDAEVYRRAESDRAESLEREVRRLRADLRWAEEALVAAESGLRGRHSRADAVSSLAEARIQVERAAEGAPWRSERIEEARAKLGEADRQIEAEHYGAALFFVYRARRIGDQLDQEARQVAATPGARFIRAVRVNLRAGPSTQDGVIGVLTRGTPVFPEGLDGDWVLVRTPAGSVGWVHTALVGRVQPDVPGPAAVR